ncbi:GntR family transcriptional regulator [Leifsonia virtsii]|uniref:GntR family transcriptional regulator n=1 Tax=Leifsonia virtsii TaxID=3035915 RepID=A0ABT8J1F2_9MICO|nr:GntR family transcriptional regulator [Leifsonia virtsii]MDN4598079.1 GntR family transcriptional regulator [Leifsonia virtsii]
MDQSTPDGRYGERRLLRNDVFELVLERILTGEYQPGERLRDADLTAWLQVSRTPVREAISRLAAVGLVETSPNRFTEVSPLDDGEVADALEVLRLLWPQALRSLCASPRLDTEVELTLLATRIERGDVDPAPGFHHAMAIVSAVVPNRVLAEALRAADLRVVRYLLLVPEARELLQRERVVSLVRALCDGAGDAEALLTGVLDDLDGVVAWRRSAAR